MNYLKGKVLKDRYRVDEFLGRGGMADVYKVWDEQRGVFLAMKVLRADLAEDRVFLRRFEREAQNLTRLQHPNIVRCYGLEREGRTAFMLMDYIEGETLRTEIFDANSPLSTDRIIEIMQPICSALGYAHEMGMVHCDVKSGNIMIHKNGTVYLTDFGIARGMDAATSTMVGIGTPAYMAPELIKGMDPTPQTDIYALGIVLYEMVTGGERPFTGERATITGTTAEKVRWEHLKTEPVPVSEFNPSANPILIQIIEGCLHKRPDERFNNAKKLAALFVNYDKGKDETITQFAGQIDHKNECKINGEAKIDEEEHVNEEFSNIKGDTSPKENVKQIKQPLIIFTSLLTIFLLVIVPISSNNKKNMLATQTAKAKATQNAIATETAVFRTTPSYLLELEKETIVEIDERIQLIENDADNYPECVYINEAKDFVITMVIRNPNDTSNGFEYGIIFRSDGGFDHYVLKIYGDGTWHLINQYNDDSKRLGSGSLTEFNEKANSSNKINLIVDNDLGLLYVNQRFISSLDLSDRYRSGAINVCTDLTWSLGETGNIIDIDYLLLEQIIK